MERISFCFVLCIVAGCRPGPSTQERPEQAGGRIARSPLPPLEGRLIDLTHTFDDATVYWPTAQVFELRRDAAGVTDKGYYYAANTFTAAEHGGTHIDAPIHFCAEGRTVDKIPLRQLIGDAALIDVCDKCAADRDYQIGVADLRAWEEKHGRQLVDVIVLLRTGFAKYWPDREKYMGTTGRGEAALADLHFPGLDPEAAKWLVEQRAPLAVGLDTPSIDYGQSTHFQSHVRLFAAGVPALENVNITDELPAVGFTIIALPIKIGGGSGGPTRVVAVVPP